MIFGKKHKVSFTPPPPLSTFKKHPITWVKFLVIALLIGVVLTNLGERAFYQLYDIVTQGSLKPTWDNLFHWNLWDLIRHLIRDSGEAIGARVFAGFVIFSIFKYIKKPHKRTLVDRIELHPWINKFVPNMKQERELTTLQAVCAPVVILVKLAFWMGLCVAAVVCVAELNHHIASAIGLTTLAGHVHNSTASVSGVAHTTAGFANFAKDYIHTWFLSNAVVRVVVFIVGGFAARGQLRMLYLGIALFWARRLYNHQNRLVRLFETGYFEAVCAWVRYTREHPELGVSDNPRLWKRGVDPDIGALIWKEKEHHA